MVLAGSSVGVVGQRRHVVHGVDRRGGGAGGAGASGGRAGGAGGAGAAQASHARHVLAVRSGVLQPAR